MTTRKYLSLFNLTMPSKNNPQDVAALSRSFVSQIVCCYTICVFVQLDAISVQVAGIIFLWSPSCGAFNGVNNSTS